MNLTVLDGAMGTELRRRGATTEGPLWSARAIDERPALVEQIHADYAAAGATVHTANTFRTTAWTCARARVPDHSVRWTREAVRLARSAVPKDHRVAGSMGPLDDCWAAPSDRPSAITLAAHEKQARLLVDAGVDLLLLETFTDVAEGELALRAALALGVPLWYAVSAGPAGDLLSVSAAVGSLERAAALGADCVLINCVASAFLERALPEIRGSGAPFGFSLNVGREQRDGSWAWSEQDQPAAAAAIAARWIDAGAQVLGGCCGTRPDHTAAMAEMAKEISRTQGPGTT